MFAVRIRVLVAGIGLAALAGCATPAPPPPSPPPPPVVVIEPEPEPVPPRPVPPGGAPYVYELPARDGDGRWITVNSALDDLQTVWNFRAGWNVAALNCTQPEDHQITPAYGAFLIRFQRQLASINTSLDQRYRRAEGSTRAATRAREAAMTQTYNYFAQPAARSGFCAAARAIAAQWHASPPAVADLHGFARAGLSMLEEAFLQFFDQYAQYQVLSAEWDRQYGAQYGASQPGYVAVYGVEAGGVAASLIAGEVPAPSGTAAIDPLTGLAVPVIPAGEGQVSTPIVQPLPAAVGSGNR